MEIKKRTNRLVLILAFCLSGAVSIAQSTGNFKGKIIDQSTKQPIIGASVYLERNQFGTTTDSMGVFTINNISIGSHTVTISHVGFQTKFISEIIIAANKTYYAEYELLKELGKLNEIVVTANKFTSETNPLTPVSTFSYSREEIFRNPGAQGDIMRALSSLPGVVSSGAQFSAIAARGQGTRDNLYMVDDIPMFDLSHLEAEGYSSGFNDPNGGRFSIFAPRVIDNVLFQNGGFDAGYGRRSSSLLGLGIKEGNKASWSLSGQFDLLGGTVMADGPISKKTSVFASARYQNFAALISILDEQRSSISYGDYIVKTTTQINQKNKLSIIAMYNPERPYKTIDDVESGLNLNDDNSGGTMLFNHRGNKALVGLNLRTLLNSNSYLKNVLYYRSSSVDNRFGRYNPSIDSNGVVIDPKFGNYEDELRTIRNSQREFGYRSIYTQRFNKVTLTAGVDVMLVNLDYARTLSHDDTLYSYRTRDIPFNSTEHYQIVSPFQYNSTFKDNAFNGSGYITLSWKVTEALTLNPSLRYDYTGFTEQHTVSPRLSGSLQLNDKQSINFASGIYYQDAAYADIAGQAQGNKLKNERSIQSVAGYKIQFSNDLKFVAEGWHKRFDDVAVQPNRNQSYITNDGSGYAYGADVSITKRLSQNYYGQLSYSYIQSKRDDHNGMGNYDYNFSIPHTISLLASYKPNNKWVFSGKFRYSTGRPTDSYIIHTNVLNNPAYLRYSQEITGINGSRLPSFLSFDMRVDYNVQRKWGTFSAFVDLVDINNRFNVNTEVFVPNTGRVFNAGLGVFPTFGVRVEI